MFADGWMDGYGRTDGRTDEIGRDGFFHKCEVRIE